MGARLKAIRNRMKSVSNTQQITRAMELIATSRIIRAQARALEARPYAKAIGDMIAMLSGQGQESPILADREVKSSEIIVMTSDRGLCGAYNSNILREAQRAIDRVSTTSQDVRLTAIGRKGIGYFKFRSIPVQSNFIGVSDRPSYANAKEIAAGVSERFISGEVDEVLIAYTDFVSTFLQRARVAKILPVPKPKEAPDVDLLPLFEFEPEPDELLDALLPRYLEVKVYAALLEAAASEHAARRRAMKEATDNAEELLKTLRQVRDRTRQAEITAELSDLVGAAEGLG